MDGTELIDTIRKRSTMPVLVLSYDGSMHHMKKAFAGGADDFLVKPFVTEECLLRAHALIRRYLEKNLNSTRSYTIIEFDDLAINVEYRKMFLHGQQVEFTSKEFSILTLLVSNPDRVYTYEQIDTVWNDTYIGDNRRIIGHVHKLRKKLDVTEGIKSVHDVGYRFKEKK